MQYYKFPAKSKSIRQVNADFGNAPDLSEYTMVLENIFGYANEIGYILEIRYAGNNPRIVCKINNFSAKRVFTPDKKVKDYFSELYFTAYDERSLNN